MSRTRSDAGVDAGRPRRRADSRPIRRARPEHRHQTRPDPGDRRRSRGRSRVRRVLGSERADDSVVGEEFGGTTTFSGRQWIIDPIDGTKNFVRGVPVWASLIALLEDGVPMVGVVSAPALQRRWWAAQGRGAFAPSTARRGGCRCPRWPNWARPACRSPACRGGRSAAPATIHRADRRRVAGAGLRRLSVLLPGGRGGRRRRRRTGSVGVGPGGAGHSGARGRRAVHQPGRCARPARRQRSRDQRPPPSRSAEQAQ